MIRELTQAAWSELADLHARERQGLLSREAAQAAAVARVQSLRYGDDGKDYFWISDMHPRMIVHPYRPDLNGQDFSEYRIARGNVSSSSSPARPGRWRRLLRYLWQWKDDGRREIPKLSYVKGFEPWGWIIGTGVYLEDVHLQISAITRRVIWIAMGFSVLVAGLLVFMTKQSLDIERRRGSAELALRESGGSYRTLIEGTTEGVALLLQGRLAYANSTLLALLGYGGSDLAGLDWERLFDPVPAMAGPGAAAAGGIRTQAIRRDGSGIDVMVGASPVTLGERPA